MKGQFYLFVLERHIDNHSIQDLIVMRVKKVKVSSIRRGKPIGLENMFLHLEIGLITAFYYFTGGIHQ
jgi:hypothetical protein